MIFFFFLVQACWLWKKGKCHFFFQLCVICKKYWCERIFQNENLFKKKVFKNEIPFFFFLSADLWQFFVSMVLLRTIFSFQEMSHLTLIYRLKAALNTMIHYWNTVNWRWYSGHSLRAVKNEPQYNLNGRWCVTSEIQRHSVILSTKKKK